jgi:hypothetical protein
MEWRDAVWILGVLLVGVLLVVPWGLLYDWIREGDQELSQGCCLIETRTQPGGIEVRMQSSFGGRSSNRRMKRFGS